MNNDRLDNVLLIEANRVRKEYFKDLVRYHELFFFFTWRDILVRYKQAFFGVAWALVRPVLNMALFVFIFGYVAQLPSGNVPYSLFVLAGIIPWMLFSGSIIDNCNSLINHSHLITKVYFPRLIIPAAQIMVHLVDFFISSLFLVCLSIYMGYFNFWTFLAFPLMLLLALLLCLGVGIWLAALTVKYRDFRIIVPFFVQFGMFISPVGYGSFIVQGKWQWLYSVNPLVGVINGFRWSMFGMETPDLVPSLVISVVFSVVTLVTGVRYFRKMERTFVDTI